MILVQEEMGRIDGCDKEKFGTFDSIEKTIALRDECGHRRPKKKRNEIRQAKGNIQCQDIGTERPIVRGVSLVGVGTVLCPERNARPMVK